MRVSCMTYGYVCVEKCAEDVPITCRCRNVLAWVCVAAGVHCCGYVFVRQGLCVCVRACVREVRT